MPGTQGSTNLAAEWTEAKAVRVWRMIRLAAYTVLILGGLLLAPAGASAATCSDYPNQAAAQRAADTRDADGDGIYCESLPCPCANGSGSSGSGGGGSSSPPRKKKPKAKPRKRAQVFTGRITSVVDGDTIKIKAFGAKRDFYTVRLIGIDTPETKRPGTPVECGGRRASAAMWRLSFPDAYDGDEDGLEDAADGLGRRISIRTDPTQDTFDRYGRLLAYITTVAGKNLQTQMLSSGWTKMYVYERRFERYGRFKAAERRARRRGRGAWKLCGGNFHRAL